MEKTLNYPPPGRAEDAHGGRGQSMVWESPYLA